MNTKLFNHYAPALRHFNGDAQASALRISSEGRLSVHYAPFEWVNPAAKIVIVGITPGPTQAVNAIEEAKRQLLLGTSTEIALMRAKKTGGFSGELRNNLVAMLDRVGFHRWAKISSSADLFGEKSDLLQTASVLTYPVFVDGKPYNGSPSIQRSPMLKALVTEHFLPIVESIPNAPLLAVGEVPFETLGWLAKQGCIDPKRILGRLPHPSGASGERIKYFLGRKPVAELSAKTNPAKLDDMRLQLESALVTSAFGS